MLYKADLEDITTIIEALDALDVKVAGISIAAGIPLVDMNGETVGYLNQRDGIWVFNSSRQVS